MPTKEGIQVRAGTHTEMGPGQCEAHSLYSKGKVELSVCPHPANPRTFPASPRTTHIPAHPWSQWLLDWLHLGKPHIPCFQAAWSGRG